MNTIQLQANKQHLSLIQEPLIWTDSKSYVRYVLYLDDDYEGLDVIVIFQSKDDETGKDIIIKKIYDPDIDNIVPFDILRSSYFSMSLYTIGNRRITTNKLVIPINYSGFSPEYESTGLLSIKPLSPYLKIAEYYKEDLNEIYARAFFARYRVRPESDKDDNPNEKELLLPERQAGGTAIAMDNFLLHNHDFYYSDMNDVLIQTENTVGVTSKVQEFNQPYVDSHEYDWVYQLLPFMLQSGMNKDGLCCAAVPCPAIVNASKPEIEGDIRDSICSEMFVWYVLNNYRTVHDVVTSMNRHIEIFFPKRTQLHWLVADNDLCGWIEVDADGIVRFDGLDGEINYISPVPKEPPAVCYGTNFLLRDVIFKNDKQVSTPLSGIPTKDNNLSEFGAGLERFNQIGREIFGKKINDLKDLKSLSEELRFSKLYNVDIKKYIEGDSAEIERVRHTDLIAPYTYPELNNSEGYEKFLPYLITEVDSFKYRRRDAYVGGDDSIHTTHTVIYDRKEMMVHISSQEEYENWTKIPVFLKCPQDKGGL